VYREIEAPVESVFEVIASIENYAKAVPHITKVEFLTESKSGVGTRFRETRLMNGKEMSSELEVTELTPNESLRIISDQGGTIWDTVFTVQTRGTGTELKMEMHAKPYKFFAKLLTPLIKSMVRKGIEADMASVKSYCEDQ